MMTPDGIAARRHALRREVTAERLTAALGGVLGGIATLALAAWVEFHRDTIAREIAARRHP